LRLLPYIGRGQYSPSRASYSGNQRITFTRQFQMIFVTEA
jgi:hypothetical protein